MNRVLGSTPEITDRGLARLKRAALRICRRLPKLSEEAWYKMPTRYSGAKRARYVQATDDVLAAGGLLRKQSRVKMFVKFELIWKPAMEDTSQDMSKRNTDPRAIQFRDPRYCVALARFLHPMEHHLYELAGDGKFLPKGRVIGKGLSQSSRAQLLVRKMRSFQNPHVLTIDCSRFDKHVSLELLRVEHSFYRAMNPSSELSRLLDMQLRNKGSTDRGIVYKTRGKRMSGDMNTALGNCVLMITMVAATLGGLMTYDILDDGDDCLVLVEHRDACRARELLLEWFHEYGMSLKIENEAVNIADVEWCQAKPIQLDETTWKFVRNPSKVFSVALGGPKFNTRSVRFRAKYINTIGLGEMILNRGVPVMQEFGLALMRNSRLKCDDVVQLERSEGLWHRLKHETGGTDTRALTRWKPIPISRRARWSFARAFGISIERQLLLEEALREWTFNLTGDTQEVFARDFCWLGREFTSERYSVEG